MKMLIGVLALAIAAPAAAHGATDDPHSGHAQHGSSHDARPAAQEHNGHETDCSDCCEKMRQHGKSMDCNKHREGADEASSDHAQHGG